uniref:Uncharacterized protein n=1 Tax=Arundo donax TaxID=35708 RepID=A0A0A9DXU1_ARUDO
MLEALRSPPPVVQSNSQPEHPVYIYLDAGGYAIPVQLRKNQPLEEALKLTPTRL